MSLSCVGKVYVCCGNEDGDERGVREEMAFADIAKWRHESFEDH